jgi:hypothetical protein
MNQRNNLLAPCGIHPEGKEQGEGTLKLIHPHPIRFAQGKLYSSPLMGEGTNNNITLGKLKH